HERVAALEARLASPPRSLAPTPLDLDAATLEQRYSGPAFTRGSLRGAMTYAGFAQFDQQRVLNHNERDLPSLFAEDPAPLAQIFAALASPHRLIVLRALCAGPRSRQELQELLGVSSAGHLYHHLKELLATGLVVQQGRSIYAMARHTIIPLCVALMVAADLRDGGSPQTQPGAPGEEEDAPADR